MKYIFLIIFSIFLVACNKSDPTPEQKDEIYKDYEQELSIATKALEAEVKSYEDLKEEEKKVVPQTGQIKFIQKKIFELDRRIDALKQQKQYFEIKLELRKDEVRQKYQIGRQGGKVWPDEEELQIYRSTIKLQRDKLRWDQTKGIKKDVPRGTPATVAK